jgi:hypothetical protein
VQAYEITVAFMKKSRTTELGHPYYSARLSYEYCRLLFENVKIKIHRTIILPVVLYGCEIWTLALRKV